MSNSTLDPEDNQYLFIDIEDPEDEQEPMSYEDVKEFILDWNADMDTDYKSIEEFNKGEDYYEIKEVKE